MIDQLLLLSGNDIPFPAGRITIHPPKLKEIAYITEQCFWPACELLKFDKEILEDKDRIGLLNISNFNIIMRMIQEKHVQAQKARINILSLLALLFPTSQISLDNFSIHLRNPETDEVGEINEENFQAFKEILIDMFWLSKDSKQYNPSGDLARKIADQFKRGRQKAAKLAPQSDKKVTILSRYVSILAVGQNKSINDLMNYTVYQLMDEFNRYQLKINHDIYIQFRCAGATEMKQPENWFKDIHDKTNKDQE